MTENKNFEKARQLLPWIAAFFAAGIGIGLILYYIIGPSEWFMTADCTDSLLWSQATLESGKLVSGEFHYAAVIPFGGNIIFLPFLAIFGYSMAAQIGGLVAYAVMLFAAAIYMLRGFGYKWYTCGGILSVFLLIMSSSAKLREIMWEHIFYYNLGLLFFCLGMGLAIRIFREGGFLDGERKPIDWVRIGILSSFALAAATNGLQSLVCFILPVLGAMFAVCFFDEEKLLSPRNMYAVLAICCVAFGTFTGMLLTDAVTGGVTAGYQEAYSTYSAMSAWPNNFLKLFTNWFSLLGVSVTAKDPMASLESVFNMIRIVCALVLLVAPFFMLAGYKNIRSRSLRMLLIGHFAVSAFIVFAVVFGNLGGANWRLTPMLGTSVLVCAVYSVELILKKGIAARFGAILLAILILTSSLAALEIAKMRPGETDKHNGHLLTETLLERGLETGYATFWQSQLITMLSDGQIRCSVILDDTSTPTKRNYQSQSSWYEDVEGEDEYFLLLTASERSDAIYWIVTNKDKMTDEFTITNEQTKETYYVFVFSENFVEGR
jgi:hypothetical protein